jgi:hypothetical protein
MMINVIGLDPQLSRTTVALLEGDGPAGGPLPLVGDGYRRHIPNATRPPGGWGTRAAETLLADALTGAGTPGPHALAWRGDPWTVPFLTGVRDRLFGYLGRQAPIGRNGYRVAVLDAPDGRTDRRAVLDEAGLTDVVTVAPTDALLARWLTDPGRPDAGDGPVVVVARTDRQTTIAGYELRGPAAATVRRIPAATATVTGHEPDLTTAVVRAVLDRCRQGATAAQVLAAFDGSLELAAHLRATPPATELTWSGSLADRMYEPLRLSSTTLAGWPGVASAAAELNRRVRTVIAVTGRPTALVVGGAGAVWPALVAPLTGLAPIWQSPEPEADLAIGAAWWPRLRMTLTAPAPDRPVAAAPQPSPPAGADPADKSALPPWLR